MGPSQCPSNRRHSLAISQFRAASGYSGAAFILECSHRLVAIRAVQTYILSMYGTPKFMRHCSPVASKSVPSGADWLHEPKLDGYRLQIVKDGRQVRLYSKGGHDWTKLLARVAEALKALPCRSAVIDAEICFPAASGAPDFRGLQAALGAKRQHELLLFAFNLLRRDGMDLGHCH